MICLYSSHIHIGCVSDVFLTRILLSLVRVFLYVVYVLRVFLRMPSSLCSTDTQHEQTEIQRTHLGVFLSIYVC